MQQHARRRLGPRALSPSTYDGLCTLSLPGFIRDGHRIPRNPSSAEEGKGAAMAKNRNKKNKAKKGGGGVAAMDTSEGGPVASTPAEAPERKFPPFRFSFRRFQWFICFLMKESLVSCLFLIAVQPWIRPRGSSHRRHRRCSVPSTSKSHQLLFFFQFFHCHVVSIFVSEIH